jgi:hypothetical protein
MNQGKGNKMSNNWYGIKPAPGVCCPEMKICPKCNKCQGHGACTCKKTVSKDEVKQ